MMIIRRRVRVEIEQTTVSLTTTVQGPAVESVVDLRPVPDVQMSAPQLEVPSSNPVPPSNKETRS